MFGGINVIGKDLKIRFATVTFLVFVLGNANPMTKVLATGQKCTHQSNNTDNTKNDINNDTGNTKIVVIIIASIVVPIVFYKLVTGCAKLDNLEWCDGWEQVAEYYKLSAKDAVCESPEYFERLADSYRCLMYKDLEIYEIQKKSKNKNKKLDLVSNYKKAQEYYQKASDLYGERANKFNDKTSYEFQINAVKSAELLAKAGECWCEIGDIIHDFDYSEEHACMNLKYSKIINCCSFVYAAEEWEKVKGIKKSYDTYADAKYCECMAKNGIKSWEEAAEAWEKVKSDEDLKKSFGEKSWRAFVAFAEANRQECLLNCGDSTKENVRNAWQETAKLDLEVNNSAIYRAFAAEAKQRARLLL